VLLLPVVTFSLSLAPVTVSVKFGVWNLRYERQVLLELVFTRKSVAVP
jgi:hypothetical protein